jgi:hypothetical protein
MSEKRCIEQILTNSHARRELLWLRAKEDGADDDAAVLERLDPAIATRLAASGLDVRELAGEPPHQRRERFGRLFDACYARHVASFEARAWTESAGAM